MLSAVFQIGLPGTQELLIVLLISVLIFAIPVVLVVWLLKRTWGSDSKNDERIAELEREVEELREERGTATGEPDDQLE